MFKTLKEKLHEFETKYPKWVLPTKISFWIGVVGLLGTYGSWFRTEMIARNTPPTQNITSYNIIGEKDPFKILNPDITVSSFKMNFGEPIKLQWNEENTYSELLYIIKDFAFKLIVSKDGNVVFYSYSPLKKMKKYPTFFHPERPLEIGTFSFNKYSSDATPVDGGVSSKDISYYEKIYFGNPGNYRTYYLGYYSRSILDFNSNILTVAVDDGKADNDNDLKIFREKMKPNVFGISSEDDENIANAIKYFGPNINYTDIDEIHNINE